MEKDANQETVESKVMRELDAAFEGKETPKAESSAAEDNAQVNAKGDETNSEKTGKPEGEDAEIEAKLAKISELLGDDEKVIEAYIKKYGYHKNPAWQKREARIKELQAKKETSPVDEETRREQERFSKIINSPEYIRTAMKAEGYKDEAIERELQKRGFDVPNKEEDVLGTVLSRLNIAPEILDDNSKAMIGDVAKIAREVVLLELERKLPQTLAPVQDYIERNEQSQSAMRNLETMKTIVKEDGILDFEKDIEPVLSKFIDDNIEKIKSKEIVQKDIFDYFKDVNYKLSIERLRADKRKEVRDDKKSVNRPTLSTQKIDATGLPKQKGKELTLADVYAQMDHLGM